MNQAVAGRLLPLVEAYAAGRATQKAFWRQMRALQCLRPDSADRGPCWKIASDKTDHCRECAAKGAVFELFAARRRENRRLRGRIEALGLRLSAPEPAEPQEPRPLLDLLEAR